MIRRVFHIEERAAAGARHGEIIIYKAEIYRWQVLGVTIWKTEKLH